MTDTTTADVVLSAHDVWRTFTTRAGQVHAVRGATLEVRAGELLVLEGRSGAGKTTLLNLLGGLDTPSSGRVETRGRDLAELSGRERTQLRTRGVGYVLQSFGLIDVLSAAENVEVPLRVLRLDPAGRDERVARVLDLVGLSAHSHQRPGELSGGQQQRVGIARALVCDPEILLADEPTGQLDSGTAATIMDLLHGLARERGVAVVVSTHDPLLVARADRVLRMHDGQLQTDPDQPVPGAPA